MDLAQIFVLLLLFVINIGYAIRVDSEFQEHLKFSDEDDVYHEPDYEGMDYGVKHLVEKRKTGPSSSSSTTRKSVQNKNKKPSSSASEKTSTTTTTTVGYSKDEEHRSSKDQDAEIEDEEDHDNNNPGLAMRSTRNFPKCRCLQKIRTSYITSSKCGQAALCYWEFYNYDLIKATKEKEAFPNGGNATENEEKAKCWKYLVQTFVCLIGYPKPPTEPRVCNEHLDICEKTLYEYLKKQCEPLVKERGLRRPEDVEYKTSIESFNYNLKYDPDKHFEPKPNSQKTTYNNFYEVTCPLVYRFPYFTIDLLLKDLDPNIEYDETDGLKEVAAMLPQFVRLGLDRDRIINFDALGVDETAINWCNIPRNYICVRDDLDTDGTRCEYKHMENWRAKCGDYMKQYIRKPTTLEVLAPRRNKA